MRLHFLLGPPLVLGLMSCVSAPVPGAGPLISPDAFAHRTSSPHAVLYWSCGRTEPGTLQVDGIAQSPWSEVQSLEFELVGVDNRERIVSETKGKAQDATIRTNQTSQFQLTLRTVGSEVRFDLFYQHQFAPEQTDSMLTGPPVTFRRLVAWGNRFLVRDACSETQHRVR
jgi:hypothetical protein